MAEDSSNEALNLSRPKIALVSTQHVLIILILVASLAFRLLWLYLPIHGDEGEAGYNAMLWARGYVPYVVRPMDKPPLMYVFYLIPELLFGHTIIPVRLINNALFVASVVALYLLVRDWYDPATGLAAAAIFGLFMSVPGLEGSYALAASISVSFIVFSIYLWSKFLTGWGTWAGLASGTMASFALLTHQRQGPVFVVLLAMAVLSRLGHPHERAVGMNRSMSRSLGRQALIVIAGAAIPVVALIGYFWSRGALAELAYYSVVRSFTSDLANQRALDLPFAWTLLTLVESLPGVILAVCGLIVCMQRRTRPDVHMLVWELSFLAPAFLIPQKFGHHFLSLVPPGAIFSALALRGLTTGSILRPQNPTVQAARVLVLAVVAFSAIGSVYFQSRQYPDFSLDWQYRLEDAVEIRISWRAEPYGNYQRQLEMARYLKSLRLRDGQLLLHGWMPETYWLAGIRAPSVHLNSFREWLGIPEQEYAELLRRVDVREFEYIVIAARPTSDPITESAENLYHYTTSIGDAGIFRKHDAGGFYVSYSFVRNFQQSSREYDRPDGGRAKLEQSPDATIVPRVVPLVIGGIPRTGIAQHPVLPAPNRIFYSYITYNSILVPKRAKLRFSIAMDPAVWDRPGDGVRFEIVISEPSGVRKVFSEYIDPKHNSAHRGWHDHEVDLRRYAGKRVDFTFLTSPGANWDSNWDWAYWGNPVIVRRD